MLSTRLKRFFIAIVDAHLNLQVSSGTLCRSVEVIVTKRNVGVALGVSVVGAAVGSRAIPTTCHVIDDSIDVDTVDTR